MYASEPALLAEATRGPITESRHRGHVAAIDGRGVRVAALGAPETATYLRSSAKPFQALPLITSGAADAFGFTPQEIAIACGSHGGEPLHTATVAGMLDKIDLGPEALQCGVHEPYDAGARRRLQASNQPPSVLHHNCSGKHAGMLAVALHLGAPTGTYLDPDHPVQQAVLAEIVRFSGLGTAEIAVAVDGCQAPVFGVPVEAMARMYARLVAPPEAFGEPIRDACRRIVEAMRAYPEMVDGTAPDENLDTSLMRAVPLALVSKVGAEGVYAAGVARCPLWPHGLGLAFKIEDGDGKGRARPPVAVELLRQAGVLEEVDPGALARFARTPVYTYGGERVGEVRPAFVIDFGF